MLAGGGDHVVERGGADFRLRYGALVFHVVIRTDDEEGAANADLRIIRCDDIEPVPVPGSNVEEGTLPSTTNGLIDQKDREFVVSY